MLGKVAERFLRREWASVQQLATELHAIFRQERLTIEPARIVLDQPDNATTPSILIRQPEGATVPAIQITRGDQTIEVGGTGGGGGGIDLGEVEFPNQDPGEAEEATPPPSDNPFPLHGRVVAKQTGILYSVRCWAKNPSLYPAIGILTVEFPDVDVDDVIPAGARCPVVVFPRVVGDIRIIDKAIGYVPVWYEE